MGDLVAARENHQAEADRARVKLEGVMTELGAMTA